MKNRILTAKTMVLLLGLLTSVGCGISGTSLRATLEAEVRPTVATPLPPIEVALKSFHGRYVTAMGEDDDWVLRQETELSDCGWFTQHHLANGKIALETCHDRYVTAPKTGDTRSDWMLRQESRLSDCGQFDLYDLGSDRVALKTCAGRFFTAGDGGWDPGLEWSVIGETYNLNEWEIFMVLLQP